jgi:hypothetical protein
MSGTTQILPLGGGGPSAGWWRGTRGNRDVAGKVGITRAYPSTTYGGPPPRSGEEL